MTNYKLVQLYKQSIITSNDNILNNDFCFYEEKTEIFKVKEVKKKGVISTENDYYSGSKKIIAGIQSLFDINYTVLSAEDKIKIGILDNIIEEIRMKDMPADYYPPKNIANAIWGICFKYADIESNNIRKKINETCFMIEKIHSIEKICNSELMFTENNIRKAITKTVIKSPALGKTLSIQNKDDDEFGNQFLDFQNNIIQEIIEPKIFNIEGTILNNQFIITKIL